MSYMKKDEDADQVMIKLDRTSVFQDGKLPAKSLPLAMLIACPRIFPLPSTHKIS